MQLGGGRTPGTPINKMRDPLDEHPQQLRQGQLQQFLSLARRGYADINQVGNPLVDCMNVNHPQQLRFFRFSRWRNVDMPTFRQAMPLVN